MRGRLIFPFLAEVHRLDWTSSRLEPGFDPDFQEAALVDLDDDGIGERVRHEHPAIRVPCQVESKVFEELRMLASGHSPRARVDLVFHFRDLEKLGLVCPATGESRIQVGDRLGAIHETTGRLVQKVRTPPGLYVTESRPIGFGLGRRPKRNLLLVTFEDRQLGTQRAG